MNETDKPKPEDTENKTSARGRIVVDTELLTISKIMNALNELEDVPSRVRVIRYLNSRLDFPLVDGSK